MKHPLLSLGLAMIFVSLGYSAEAENPYKKSKVGDYYTFKMSTKISGVGTEGELTQTVSAKTDKEATILLSGKLLGQGMEVMIPVKEEKIDLTKPYDPAVATGNVPPGAKVDAVKQKEGTEKLTLGRNKDTMKAYATQWESYKMKMSNMGMDFEADLKVWHTKDANVPMVKMEMSSDVMGFKIEVTMELVETGNKPLEKAPEKAPEKK